MTPRERLKGLMKDNNLSAQDVRRIIERFEDRRMSTSTVYKWLATGKSRSKKCPAWVVLYVENHLRNLKPSP